MPVHVSTRVALATLGVLLELGFCACVHSTDAGDQPGSAGASGSASASDASSDAAPDGEVEQVDAATSCSDLYTLARQQLDEASACDASSSASQCTGLVNPTCGCPIAVNSQTSVATQSYLNTLAVIQAKMCGGNCPPEFCPPTNPGTCVNQIGGSGGVCVRRP